MPIYEYQCSYCHHDYERLQKISDKPLVTCPQCGKDGLKKKISSAGFQLKGTGWYVTDFKNPPKKSAPGSETKPTESVKETVSKPTSDSHE